MVVPALTGAGIGLGTGLLTGDGFSDDDWWQNALMGLGSGAAFGGMGGMDKLSGMFGSSIGGSSALNPLAPGLTTGKLTIPSGVFAGPSGLQAVPAAELAANTVPFAPGTGLLGGMGGIGDLMSTDNMYKGLIASTMMKNMKGKDDQIKPPPPVAPSFSRPAPPPANVAGVRRPIMGGGFMGNQRGGLGSRRY
jgi:hypothetical protein